LSGKLVGKLGKVVAGEKKKIGTFCMLRITLWMRWIFGCKKLFNFFSFGSQINLKYSLFSAM